MTSISRTRHHEQVQELCAAAARAISGEPGLLFHGPRLYRRGVPVPATAPHLYPAPEDDFTSFRGAADGLALRLLHSDPMLHRREAPEDAVARLIFEMLEQFRVESLLPGHLPGVRHNLRHRHETWSAAFHGSGLTETHRGLLVYTTVQVCRARVMGEQVVEETEDLLEAPRFSLAHLIGTELAGLRRTRRDQAAYAVHARTLAAKVSALVHEPDAAAEASVRGDQGAGFSLWVETDEADEAPAAGAGGGRPFGEVQQGYRVFTAAYDREVEVAEWLPRSRLAGHRERLDELLDARGIRLARLVRALHALYVTPTERGWDDAQEEGYVDGHRLSLLASSPAERRLFRTVRDEPTSSTVVTLLVDCSGSMRQHHESVAMVVDTLARALELAGVASEVLGFTTRAWNGGRALREWRRGGRPAHPGRLNELHHLVFKDADTPWRRARPAIAGLLKEDLYREGVDGEAVEWACRRSQGRPEQRRVLLVFSDGSPMDSATNLTNSPHFLDQHLREVVARQQALGTEILGVGVGLDLSPYYAHSHVLDLEQGVGNEVFDEIIRMLAAHTRR